MIGEPGTGEVPPIPIADTAVRGEVKTRTPKKNAGEQGGAKKAELHYLTLADKIEVKPPKITEGQIRSLLGQYERYNMILAGRIPSDDTTGRKPEIIREELIASESTLKGVLNELGYWEQVRAIRLAHRGTSTD